MKLHLNPIMRKELKLGARTIKFPIGIAIYAFAFAVISLFLLVAYSQWIINAFGGSAYSGGVEYTQLTKGFVYLAGGQIFMICIIVPVLTAGSIAGERERQTLDIMLTAPVSAFSITIGKLTAALANVFLFVISTLPAMALCFLYGGIEWKYLFIFVVDIMILAFFIGSIGIWCSTVLKKTIAAVIMTMLWEFIFYVIPLVVYWMIYGVKFQQAAASLPAGQSVQYVNMGFAPFIFFLDPAITCGNALLKSTSSQNLVEALSTDLFGTTTLAKGITAVSNYWSLIGFAIMILIGFLFLYLAARKIEEPGRVHGKRK